MGNNPSAKRRGSEDEETIGTGGTPTLTGKKKLIVQPSQDIHNEDAITKILNQSSLSHLRPQLGGGVGVGGRGGIGHGGDATHGVTVGIDGTSVYSNDSASTLRPKTLPTVFKWEGGGKDVYISGTFNNWSAKIPMVKSSHNFYTIVDLPEGEHQYKFIVDGQWKVDTSQTCVNGTSGAQNNKLTVKASDFDVLEALSHDMAHSKTSGQQYNSTTAPPTRRQRTVSVDSGAGGGGGNQDDPNGVPIPSRPLSTMLGGSPPGDYSQDIPHQPFLAEIGSEKNPTPPLIPPQLLQVILNKNTGANCDPNLLPHPHHVMVNHMYALSIKDGVIVLSAITRYRKKFVSTVIYKPI